MRAVAWALAVWVAIARKDDDAMAIGRRELMGWAGGAVTGVALSPVPWKLLDDSAIWTQNWPWTPTPARGPVTEKQGLCTMCAAGCGVKARCGAAGVFGVAPAAAHPAGGGALCAAVYGAHQLAYHPRRLKTAIVDGRAVGAEEAIAEAARRMKAAGAQAGILDERPGRVTTRLWAGIARAQGGSLLTTAQVEDRTLRVVEELTGAASGSLGYDFEHAGVIVSIGAPLLDAWGSAGRMGRLWSEREEAGAPLFVHVGSRWSRTAQMADRMQVIRPGSEAALIAALAGKLAVEEAADRTGLAPSRISDLAFLIRQRRTVVVGGGEAASGGFAEPTERMVAALNLLLGSVGVEGGIVARRALPGAPEPPLYIDRLPDHSLAVLVHEAGSGGVATVEALLRRKLRAEGTMVRFSAFLPESFGPRDILIPATTMLESAEDAAGARDAAVATWTCAGAVSKAPDYALTPAAFAGALARELGAAVESYEKLCSARAQAIVRAKRGRLYRHSDGGEMELTDVKAFEAAMAEGAVWEDDRLEPKPPRAEVRDIDWTARREELPALIAMAESRRDTLSTPPAAPLASKLDRETRLFASPGEVRLHPRTARELRLKPGESVTVSTQYGESRGRVRCEAWVIPGQVELAACGEGRELVLEAMGAGEPGSGAAPAARIRRS